MSMVGLLIVHSWIFQTFLLVQCYSPAAEGAGYMKGSWLKCMHFENRRVLRKMIESNMLVSSSITHTPLHWVRVEWRIGSTFPWMEGWGHKKGGSPFVTTSIHVHTPRHRVLSFRVSLILAQAWATWFGQTWWVDGEVAFNMNDTIVLFYYLFSQFSFSRIIPVSVFAFLPLT